jgi:hypothetical protein
MSDVHTTTATRPRAVREIALIVVLLAFYKNGRSLTRHHEHTAMSHARTVVGFERRLGVFTEGALQRLTMHSRAVVEFLNRYYASVHFTTTALFFAWVLIWHPFHYRRIRTWFAVVTALGLALHIAYPLAPPRMLHNEGFIDTLREFGPRIYNADTSRSVANQFAAMPSLHFGWALMVAVGFIQIVRKRWSYVALIHPFLTLMAIVATANHYWLDAAIAALLVVCSAAVLNRFSRRNRARVDEPDDTVTMDPEPHVADATAAAGAEDSGDRVLEAADH